MERGVAGAVWAWRFAGILVLLIKNYIWEAFKRNILMINPIAGKIPEHISIWDKQ